MIANSKDKPSGQLLSGVLEPLWSPWAAANILSKHTMAKLGRFIGLDKQKISA